ncbi:hypothetical protein N7G274_007217 [Stereocaulon virgatum]|uniref:Tetratricopeptide repeat domain-containing protein n=1 Tax=Stereocaulon virgatum TaxID=373712 RepID=A0ABR4A1I9_9LECA
MVFVKPLSNFARHSFGKTLTHGYAQSLVAGTQSTNLPFGNHPTNRVRRPQTAQLHTAFQNQNASSTPAVAVKPGNSNAEKSEGYVDILNQYYEAWQKHQQRGEEGTEWKQFQFTKLIGWKPASVVPDVKGKELSSLGSHADASVDRAGLGRAYSTSAVEDIKKAEDSVAEAVAVAKVDEAIATEITQIQHSSVIKDEPRRVSVSAVSQGAVKQAVVDAGRSPSTSSILTAEESAQSTPFSDLTAATSRQGTDSQAFSEHLSKLYEQQHYGQIPPAFQSMLEQGLRPTVRDYNALLASAIHLPIARHQVVPKALDIYSDMLRRQISPDTAFYTTLIQLLSRRASDVTRMKEALDKKRLRFGGLNGNGSFLFASNETDYAILSEDDALSNAVKIFDMSTSIQEPRLYSAETYRLLVTSCAFHGRVEDMIRAYNHLESQKVKPLASMFPPMIEAFAKSGDLVSAVECYNEYKALAMVDDAGSLAIIDRKDNEVYAALIKAYAMCGKVDGGQRFLGKIVDSYANVTENRKERLEAVQDTVILNALVEERLNTGDYAGALRMAEERSLTPSARSQAMARISVTAADHGDVSFATKAYQYLDTGHPETYAAALSMLALHIRTGNLDATRDSWALLTSASEFDASFIEPTALYATALIRNGNVDEGLMQARESFGRIRASASSVSEIIEEIDEAIEFVGAFLAKNKIVPSPNARLSFLWTMVENGGLVSPVAEQMLAGLGPEDIVTLSWQDMTLALQVEAGLIGNGQIMHDIAHSARFAHLLNIAVGTGAPLDVRTTGLVEKALEMLAKERPDLVNKWRGYQQGPSQEAYLHRAFTPQPSPALSATPSFADSFDPYAATTDYRGSTIIAEELETRRNSAGLNEALQRFRNIRRAGRHPRYIVYAKLISAAAKEGRNNLIHDILGMARTDVPFIPEYSVVRHGWSSILDSMVGACLTVGRRSLAAQFHQEMLDMGTAPTANTFGLYITTLKDSTKTFDEASEAVAIFGRAVSEGVTPSSFLYNALIGKLGKARRIDDCLRYFQEMRAAGIRPTSVTYGTVVNALCRVSDDRFAEELFDEMESMPNYKPRPAPYNSLMQFFLTTKRDSSKVLAYYKRMQSRNIQPTMHTYKLLIDTYATLEPVNLAAAQGVFDVIRASGQSPEAVHYASLIHAKGCALHDMDGARQTFDEVLASGEIRAQACLYQALFESMVANHCVAQTEGILDSMSTNRVEMTPYIANTLIHGWAMENNIEKSKAVYDTVGMEKREPSTYEAMTRAFLAAQDREGALATVHEMLSRGYPSAVSSKILELVGHGSIVLSDLIA